MPRTDPEAGESAELARSITLAEGGVSFYLIRLLARRHQRDDAFRAYGYFRWVDDRVDDLTTPTAERLAFLRRQADLASACFRGASPEAAAPEEWMLIDLVAGDPRPGSGMATYIRSMLELERFDCIRRGRLISGRELAGYTRRLAAGVTHILDYFLGQGTPESAATAHLAVGGAHVAHMLRDTLDDVRLGYYNVPREVLERGGITPDQVDTPAFRAWVRRRVHLARRLLRIGRDHLLQARRLRFRLACLVYALRFESLLGEIEARDYRMAERFPPPGRAETVSLAGAAWMQSIPLARPNPVPPRSVAARSDRGIPAPGFTSSAASSLRHPR